jgi:hypothetical protein
MRIFRKWIQEADKNEWVVIIASLLFVIPFISQHMFGGFWDATIAQTIKIIGWTVAVFMSFVIGIRGTRLNGLKGKTKSYLLIGTILSISIIGINIAFLIMVPKTLDLFRSPDERIIKLESMLEAPDLDNERKALISSFIASEKYQQSGELVDVYDKDGIVSEYFPTETDKEILEGRTRVEYQIGEIKKSTFIFISVLIISILVGALTPIKRKEVYTN